jgi:nitrite reductase/ring-hydroxylating ferredoxin subunit
VSWHDVLAADELPEASPAAVQVDGRAVCVVRLDGALHAFDDACPHRQWPLHLGALSGSTLTCRAHTWEWDVRDGSLQRMRAPECLVLHEAREADGRIAVRVAADAPPAKPISRLYERMAARDAAGAQTSAPA